MVYRSGHEGFEATRVLSIKTSKTKRRNEVEKRTEHERRDDITFVEIEEGNRLRDTER